MSNAWKQAEKRAAKTFNGTRNTRGNDFSESIPDITTSFPITVEVKYRKKLPMFLKNILLQALSYDKNKTPIGYLQEKYSHHALVFMYAEDFKKILEQRTGTKKTR